MTTPHALSGPVDVEQPLLLPPDEAEATELNPLLEHVFAETSTALPKLIAQVRTQLRLQPEAMAQAAGLSAYRYAPTERDAPDATKGTIDRYTGVLNAWRVRGVSEDVREQCLRLLNGDTTLYAFYLRMGADLGFETVNGQIPNIWTRWQQRVKVPDGLPPAVPNVLEVLTHVATAYATTDDAPKELQERYRQRREEADRLWQAEAEVMYEARTIPAPLRRFLVAAERYLAVEHHCTLTAKALREHLGFSLPQAQRLLICESVPWDAVELAVGDVGLGTDVGFARAWLDMVAEDEARDSYERGVYQALGRRGYTLADCARWLGITTDGSKDQSRADNVVRTALDQGTNSAQVPPCALIALVAADAADGDRLTEVYRRDRERYYRRTGSWLRGPGLELRLRREWAGEGVALKPLADYLRGVLSKPVTEKQLQQMEEKPDQADDAVRAEVLSALDALAAQRIRMACERRSIEERETEERLGWKSVRSLTAAIMEVHGGAKPVSRLLRAEAEEQSLWLSAADVQRVAEGTLVPPLPVLCRLAQVGGNRPLPGRVTDTWFHAYPAWLRDRPQDPVLSTLARMLLTMIARVDAGNPRAFYEQRYLGGVGSHASMRLHKLAVGEKDSLPREQVENTALSAGYEPGTLPYLLALSVHACRGNVALAIERVASEHGELIASAQRSDWVGLTDEELPARSH